MKQFRNINGPSGVLVYVQEMPSLRDVSWDVASEVAELTDSGRLFQREGAQD